MLPPSECESYPSPPPIYYQYYDTPDGCDIDKKMFALGRWGAIAGMVIGAYDILLYSHARGAAMFMRLARHVVPLTLMGVTFPLVSSGLVQSRCIDDRLNYFLGGLACGPLMGLYTGSMCGGGVMGGICLGCIALAQKEALIYNKPLFPCHRGHENTVNSWRKDWTLAEDPKEDMMKKCANARANKQ